MKVNVDFCERAAKEKVGISMNQICAMHEEHGGLGLDESFWSHVKKGNSGLSEENVEKLANLFDCLVSDITKQTKKATKKSVDVGSLTGVINDMYNEIRGIKSMLQAIMDDWGIEKEI